MIILTLIVMCNFYYNMNISIENNDKIVTNKNLTTRKNKTIIVGKKSEPKYLFWSLEQTDAGLISIFNWIDTIEDACK